MRHAATALLFAMLLLLSAACGAVVKQCKVGAFHIDNHPTKPKPAGKITVWCDGVPFPVSILADEVTSASIGGQP